MPAFDLTPADLQHLHRAVALALETEKNGNLPIGAVITLNGEMIAEAGNAMLSPYYHPGRHAEIEALQRVPVALWPRSREMTCYSTLEPCTMCMGALLLHGIGRVIFGAKDHAGGADSLLAHLPPYYAEGKGVPQWRGPALPEICDPLYQRALSRFDQLACGRGGF
ncbi:MAG: tRNA-specific adenosine deaminase [bacterium]|nr:tRNA-specific adenosine deaminase [bacterium]